MFRKLLIFLLPFGLIVAVYTGILIYIGESMPLGMVVALQMDDTPTLYRPQFGNRDIEFKALSINTRHPEVVALGSSRVLQMRAGLLTENPDVFYNAGAPAWTLPQITQLLHSLNPDALPKILILGIDPPWFNDAYEVDVFPPQTNDLTNLFTIDRSMAQLILGENPFDLNRLLARRSPDGLIALGKKAIENGHGFRNDGSEQYGDFLVGQYLSPPTERERHQTWMREGEEMYVYGDTVSETLFAQFRDLLIWCKERNIIVIGFMPPYSPTLYAEMNARGNHTYIGELVSRLDALFVEQGFYFFGYNDGNLFGIDDDFFDGWHGSERVYLRLYTQMVEALPQILGQYSNAGELRAIDAGVTDTWRVFGD